MGLGKLFGSENFRVFSNVTRLSVIPSLIAVAYSELFKQPILPKTGISLYLLSGAMTALVGVLILSILDSKKKELTIYSNPLLNGLLNAAEKMIFVFCYILKYPAYLIIILSVITTPFFALLSKRDEFQGMPVVLVPDSMLNLIAVNIVAVVFVTAVTSGHSFPIYRSFKVLKKFDEFRSRKGNLKPISYWPVFGELVPTLTFYAIRIAKTLAAGQIPPVVAT